MTNSDLLDVLQKHRPGLLRMLTKRLGCAHTANDVFQMVAEQLVSSAASLDVNQPPAYLYRAASNMASSFQRAANTRNSREAAVADFDEHHDNSGPEQHLNRDEALRVVESALQELPLLTRRMFIAFRIHGVRQQDIARKYGVSLSTVEKRIAKATLHCHRRLRESVTPSADPAMSEVYR